MHELHAVPLFAVTDNRFVLKILMKNFRTSIYRTSGFKSTRFKRCVVKSSQNFCVWICNNLIFYRYHRTTGRKREIKITLIQREAGNERFASRTMLSFQKSLSSNQRFFEFQTSTQGQAPYNYSLMRQFLFDKTFAFRFSMAPFRERYPGYLTLRRR